MSIFKRTVPALRSNRPHDPFALMNEIMSSMWSDNPSSSMMKEFAPSIEVKETKNDYSVIAEIPGMAKEDIDVSFENNTLYLKGEKKSHRENKDDERVHYSERFYGSFMRAIPFGDEIDAGKIEADYNNGVLSVKLAKVPVDVKPAASKIPVR